MDPIIRDQHELLQYDHYNGSIIIDSLKSLVNQIMPCWEKEIMKISNEENKETLQKYVDICNKCMNNAIETQEKEIRSYFAIPEGVTLPFTKDQLGDDDINLDDLREEISDLELQIDNEKKTAVLLESKERQWEALMQAEQAIQSKVQALYDESANSSINKQQFSDIMKILRQ